MNRLIPLLLAGAAAASLSGCAATPAAMPVAATNSSTVCGTYGYVDINNDGWISGSEWATYGTKTYSFWDANADGRIDRAEFERCYRAGGFYAPAYYNPDYWTHYWTTFDTNGDGYLSPSEYWSANTYATIDRNRNGRIDSDEWVWWPR